MPVSSPYSDRFIPSRVGSGDFHSAFELLGTGASDTPQNADPNAGAARSSYQALLRSELLDARTLDVCAPAISKVNEPSACDRGGVLDSLKRATPEHRRAVAAAGRRSSRPASGSNIFRFHAGERPLSAPAAAVSPECAVNVCAEARVTRKIPRAPFKVLDAPCLKDDFYLNLVDWSCNNVLAVGLGSCVYLWSAHTSVVTKLCELKFGGPVCSVSWSQQGSELAVGTAAGLVQVWDAASCKLLRTMTGHNARVGCLAWSSSLLSSGGRDFDVYNRDLRARESYVARLAGHRHEVCGLKWAPDDTQLASGGNDNKLLVWNAANTSAPQLRFSEHEAAVKAIAWSPHSRGVLASGGGTQDKKIRFWNTMTDTMNACVDTGSQVCNLAWSKNVNEIVSTHGYSQNQIVVWKYPSLSKVATLTGHLLRVLYLAMSPSGETIVTGAGDETLRFWNVFPGARGKRGDDAQVSALSPARMHIR